jgi:hypothetical protein
MYILLSSKATPMLSKLKFYNTYENFVTNLFHIYDVKPFNSVPSDSSLPGFNHKNS